MKNKITKITLDGVVYNAKKFSKDALDLVEKAKVLEQKSNELIQVLKEISAKYQEVIIGATEKLREELKKGGKENA